MIDRLTAQVLSSIPTWLQILTQIYPPRNITLVGAGNGTDLLVGWLKDLCKSSANTVSKVILVEPDELSHKQLAKRIVDQHHWQLLADMVVPNKMINTDNEYPYYQCSLASENGLLVPHSLKPIWPGILLKSQQYLTGLSLNQLFPSDWLLLDCLPAAELLDGIEIPESTQVILTRAIMNQEVAPLGSSFDEINYLLEPNGFKAIAFFEERNSNFGKVIFVREPSKLQSHLEAERLAKESEISKVTEAQKKIADLSQAQAELQSRLEGERQVRAKELEDLQIKFVDLAEKHTNEIAKVSAENNSAKAQAKDLQRQVNSAYNKLAKFQIENQKAQYELYELKNKALEVTLKNEGAGTAKPKLLAEFNLGEAWSGNTVNTVIFRHHGIFTYQGYQFTSFYVDEHTLRFVSRRLSDNRITHFDLKDIYNLKDAHNSISMGADREGYLHVCFDHHTSKMRYRRSLKPMSIDGWSDEQPMTGHNEDLVTYPTFILPRAGYPLTLLYRDGSHNNGCARIKYYDERTQSWNDKATPILSGADQKPWTSNAYWNHPAIGNDGSLHLSFVWRTGLLGEEQLVNNINIGYAWSPDNGHHWYTLQGQPYQVPITPTTAETIWPMPPGSNLINQCSMALDAFNRPHIVFYANDADGRPQYQHLRHDGKTWHHQVLSQRTESFNLMGGGTLQIPISRPEVLLDLQGNALVIYRGDLTNDRMTVIQLNAPSFSASDSTQHVLHSDFLGNAEPMVDREGWKLNQKLSILLQHNYQPNHDADIAVATAPVRLCEFELQTT